MSDWLSDCCLMPNQKLLNYIMVRTSYISTRWWWCLFCTRLKHIILIFIVLPWVNMSLHSDTLSWFWVTQSLLLLLNAAYLAEKQQIHSLWFDLTGNSNPQITHLRQARQQYYHLCCMWICRFIIKIVWKCSGFLWMRHDLFSDIHNRHCIFIYVWRNKTELI